MKLKVMLSVVMLIFQMAVVQATTLQEHETLGRLIAELNNLSPLLSQLSKAADPSNKYAWLESTILQIKDGVEEHYLGASHVPRKFERLNLEDYAYSDRYLNDYEREIIGLLINELENINPLINEAEKASNPDEPVSFRYDWFRNDIRRIQRVLQTRLLQPKARPRQFKPVPGEQAR